MSTKNKSVASQALLEMNSIREFIKDESKDMLKSLLSEAVKDVIRESTEEEDDDLEIERENDGADKNESDKESGKKSKGDVSEDGDEELMDDNVPAENGGEGAMPMDNGAAAEGEGGAEEMPASDTQEAPEGEGENDEWSEFDEYQVGDNTYDLTGEQDYDKVVKVYKLMKDTDQICVKQEGNTIQLQDNGTGEEYVIDLGGDNEGEAELMTDNGEQMAESVIREASFDVDDSEFDDFFHNPDVADDEQLEPLENEYEFDLGDMDQFSEGEEDDNIAGMPSNQFEGKKSRKTMKENREIVLEVDIHDYTDNYQNVDPIEGLSNDEPSKSGKTWEKGVPTGTKKPWAGDSKSKGKPFGKKAVDEETIEETATSVSTQGTRNMGSKTHTSAPRKNNLPKVSKHVSAEGNYNETLGESYKKVNADLVAENNKLKAQLKAIMKENKELKNTVLEVRTGLHEQRVTTVNLAKIVKLFTENAVSQAEKANIINRFSNEAKTIEQSKALYESIDKEYKNKKGATTVSINESMTATPSRNLNESKTKSKDLLETLDFIKRMENC